MAATEDDVVASEFKTDRCSIGGGDVEKVLSGIHLVDRKASRGVTYLF